MEGVEGEGVTLKAERTTSHQLQRGRIESTPPPPHPDKSRSRSGYGTVSRSSQLERKGCVCVRVGGGMKVCRSGSSVDSICARFSVKVECMILQRDDK